MAAGGHAAAAAGSQELGSPWGCRSSALKFIRLHELQEEKQTSPCSKAQTEQQSYNGSHVESCCPAARGGAQPVRKHQKRKARSKPIQSKHVQRQNMGGLRYLGGPAVRQCRWNKHWAVVSRVRSS